MKYLKKIFENNSNEIYQRLLDKLDNIEGLVDDFYDQEIIKFGSPVISFILPVLPNTELFAYEYNYPIKQLISDQSGDEIFDFIKKKGKNSKTLRHKPHLIYQFTSEIFTWCEKSPSFTGKKVKLYLKSFGKTYQYDRLDNKSKELYEDLIILMERLDLSGFQYEWIRGEGGYGRGNLCIFIPEIEELWNSLS